MNDQRPRCPACKGLLKHEPASVVGPERVYCICGWSLYRNSASPNHNAFNDLFNDQPKKEKTAMAKNPRGTCHICNRDDVLLISNKGPCHRCYKQGKTQPQPKAVIRSTPTDEEKAAFAEKPMKTVSVEPSGAQAQAIEKPAAPAPSTTAYNVDIIAALDEAWQMKRAKFADDLKAQTTSAERLKLGFRMLATITAVGY